MGNSTSQPQHGQYAAGETYRGATSHHLPPGPTLTHLSNSAAQYGSMHGADDEYDAEALGFSARNTSGVDPRTGIVLPMVNPLAQVPQVVRAGLMTQVVHNQSHDVRGDLNHLVGYSVPDSNANPRALGAVQDRKTISRLAKAGQHTAAPGLSALPHGSQLKSIPHVESDDDAEDDPSVVVRKAHKQIRSRYEAHLFGAADDYLTGEDVVDYYDERDAY